MTTAKQLIELCDAMLQATTDAEFDAATKAWDAAIATATPEIIAEAKQ